MSTKYKATTTDQAYFITITAVGWVDACLSVDRFLQD